MSFQHAIRLSVDKNTDEWILRDSNNPDRVFRCFDSLFLAKEILGSYGMSDTLELILISSQPYKDINFSTLFLSDSDRGDQKRRMSLISRLPSQVDGEEQRWCDIREQYNEQYNCLVLPESAHLKVMTVRNEVFKPFTHLPYCKFFAINYYIFC